MSCFKIWFVISLVLSSALSARILGLFPFPSISHQVVFRAITTELVRKGHEVTVLTPDPVYQKGEGPKNFIEIDVHDVSYEHWKNIASTINGANSMEIMVMAVKAVVDIFEKQINSDGFKAAVGNTTNTGFDLILAEAFIRPTLAFSNIYKAPVVQISSLGSMPVSHFSFGMPTHPLIYPLLTSHKIYNHTVWEKIQETYYNFFTQMFVWDDGYEDEMLKRNFGKNIPSINELSSNADLLILNMNSMWEGNRPVPPGVIQVSGLHLKPRKDLPKDLHSFLNASKNGVIYFSLGTNFDLTAAGPGLVEKFNNVFARLPYDVIWKWNKEVMPGKAHNVKLMKWVPQADLLYHPNIKAFITQAGLQSTDEAINAQVPLIAFPTAADQWYNAEQYTFYKIGIHLDLLSFTEDQLHDAVITVIENNSYRQNIKRLAHLIKDTPDTALNTAVWWIEYVIRNGGAKHLRSRGAGVPWSEYLMLDVVFTVLFTLVGCFVTIGVVVNRFVIRGIKKIKQKSL